MKRDIYKQLENWKKSDRRKPLILNGARQVGKTYALKHFANTSYKKFAYFNFDKEETLCEYFNTTLMPNEIINFLKLHTRSDITPNDTLIIFDEIQECPKALSSLKYFCEEANDYHIAAAGSLLGVKTAKIENFPVGKVNFLHMYPLTFFEFLSAMQEDDLRKFLENISDFEPLPNPLHEKLLHLLKNYFCIGGMPEAVAYFAKNQDFKNVREIQLEILSAYERDFSKHAPANEIMKITTVWKQIHKQLAKENKKFIFSAIRKSARGRDYEDAISWLLDAGLIHKSYLVESVKFPLSAYSDNNIFKIFLIDIGLLVAQSHLSFEIILQGNLLFTEFKGALSENFVAQELIATKNQNPYYWTSEGTAEIDFLIEDDHEILPLEVKSGDSLKKKSLIVYNQKYQPSKLLRANTLNLKHDGNIYNYPLYLICKIPIK